MCGIIGYIGSKQAAPIIINGLKLLEYRGYDSCGICLVDQNGLNCQKSKGRISQLANKISPLSLRPTVGIGHTRWATHGEPSAKNAHPLLDCKKTIAVAHNGIIENYQSLKTSLGREGHIFSSQTDSETISHLIEKFYHHGLETAVMKTCQLLKGSFGLAIIDKKGDKIMAVKNGSPLAVGIGNGEMFLASDASAILPYTQKIVYLKDGEMAIITAKNFSIKNLNNGSPVNKKIQTIKLSISEIEKGSFKHFMLKEIFEQPQALMGTISGYLKNNQIKLSLSIAPKDIQRIIIVACGTSYHAGLLGKYIIENISRIPTEVETASEFRYRNPIIKNNNLVIAISQSGETADTLAAIKLAKQKGAKTLGIINADNSSIAREVDSVISIKAGLEIGVACTKAFTCQAVALALLSIFLGQKLNRQIDQKIINEIKRLPVKLNQALKTEQSIQKTADKLKHFNNFFFLGRGYNFPIALEGALKLKECSYVHAEGYPAAEMKHGPLALIDAQTPVVFIAPKDATYDKIINNIQEVKARKGKILAIINDNDKKAGQLADWTIRVPKTIDLLSPIVNVIPLQLLAYHMSCLKGIDPDKPRNLAKSVTVE